MYVNGVQLIGSIGQIRAERDNVDLAFLQVAVPQYKIDAQMMAMNII
jgi:hypothetical protein